MTFIYLSVSLWNDHTDHVFDVVGRAGLKRKVNAFCWPKLFYPFLNSSIIPHLFFLLIGWYCGRGVFGLIGCRSLSPCLALPTCFNNNNNNNISHHQQLTSFHSLHILSYYQQFHYTITQSISYNHQSTCFLSLHNLSHIITSQHVFFPYTIYLT